MEHTLGPSRGGSVHRSETKERVRLDLSRTAARKSRDSSNDSSVSLGFDDDDDAGRSNGTKDKPRVAKVRGKGGEERDKGKVHRGDEKKSSGAKKKTSSNAAPHRDGPSGPSAIIAENAGKAGAVKSEITRTRTRTRGGNATNVFARTSSAAVAAEATTASRKAGDKNTKQKLSVAAKRQASVRGTRTKNNEDTESQTEGSSEQTSSNDGGHNEQRHDQKSRRRSRGGDTSESDRKRASTESYSSNRRNGEDAEKSAARSTGERRNSRSRRTSSAAESSDLSEDKERMTVDGQYGNKGGNSPTMSTSVGKARASDRGKDKKKQDGKKGKQLASADDVGGEQVTSRSERVQEDKTSSSRRRLSRSHERRSKRDGDTWRETKQVNRSALWRNDICSALRVLATIARAMLVVFPALRGFPFRCT